MQAPAYLLFVMGLLGATDIVLFHTWTHALRRRPEAWKELVTHFLRGPTYAALFLLVPNFTFHGAWFVGLLALLAFDVLISIADFWLEPASRAPQGGLPRGEYVLHSVLAMLFGAVVATTFAEGSAGLAADTRLAWQVHGVPVVLRVLLAAMAPVVLLSGLLDLRAALRLRRTAP